MYNGLMNPHLQHSLLTDFTASLLLSIPAGHTALDVPSTWNAVPPNDQVLACSWLDPLLSPDPCPNITSSVRPSMTHLNEILNESLNVS